MKHRAPGSFYRRNAPLETREEWARVDRLLDELATNPTPMVRARILTRLAMVRERVVFLESH